MRVKRGVTARARHNKIRKATKGMTLSNRSSVRRGKQAVIKAMENAHRDRREKKRTFRQLWNARINAAARENGTTYSKLIHGMTKNEITVNRKMLSEIAISDPAAFTVVVAAADNSATATKTVSNTAKTAAKPAVQPKPSAKPVDLTIVEGIGPKISELLIAAGIDSFQKLADASVDQVKEVLEAAGSRYNSHDPTTWAEQAKLAADGKFDELETLKDKLDGGKR